MAPTLKTLTCLALSICAFAIMTTAAPSNSTATAGKGRQGPGSQPSVILPVKPGAGNPAAASSRPGSAAASPVKSGTGAQSSIAVPAGSAGSPNPAARPRPVRSPLNFTLSHREADKASDDSSVDALPQRDQQKKAPVSSKPKADESEEDSKDSDEAPQKPQRNPLFHPLHFQPSAAGQPQGSESSTEVRSPTNKTLPVTAAASANNGTGSGHKFLGFSF